MSTQDSSRDLPSWWIICRDIGLFLAGLAFLFMEVRRPEVRDSVLILVGGMLGIPAAFHSGSALIESLAQRRAGTRESSPSSPEAPPPSSVSS